jgi:hypothetical protein
MRDDEEYYSDYYTETESSTYETEEEHYSDDFEEVPISVVDESIVDDRIVYTQWRMIKLGDTTLRISNTGKVQYTDISIFSITNGLKEPGTPYRYVIVEDKKYLVHELVWRAFYTDPIPPDYQIRHDYAPLDEEECYSNELQYLDLFHNSVQPLPNYLYRI